MAPLSQSHMDSGPSSGSRATAGNIGVAAYPIALPGSKSPVIACRKDQRIIPDIDKGDKAMSRGYGDNIQMETMLRGRR